MSGAVVSSFFKPSATSHPAPRAAGESCHAFFDRVEGAYWDEVREVADDFLNRVPRPAQRDIVGRWRSGDDASATSAWWEVYLHEWLIRSGFSVQVHEVQANGRAPDFRADRDGLTIYLEATGPGVSGEQRAKGNRQNDLFNQLNQVKNERYVLWIRHLNVGTKPIRFSDWRRKAEKWLGGLDDGGSDSSPDPLVLNEGDWAAVLVAFPRKGPVDPRLGPRSIGIYPMEGGVRDDVQYARRLLQSKRAAYGTLDGPLVIAAWVPGILHRPDEWRAALFGSIVSSYALDGSLESVRQEYDGLWGGGSEGWKDTHVGGVLIGLDPSFHTIGRSVPQWWAHPNGGLKDRDLSALAECYVSAPEAELAQPSQVTPSQFFGLPDPWPVAGDPWQRTQV